MVLVSVLTRTSREACEGVEPSAPRGETEQPSGQVDRRQITAGDRKTEERRPSGEWRLHCVSSFASIKDTEPDHFYRKIMFCSKTLYVLTSSLPRCILMNHDYLK